MILFNSLTLIHSFEKISSWNEKINNIFVNVFFFTVWQLHSLEVNSMTVNAWTLLLVLDLPGKNDLCSNASVKVLYGRRVTPCASPKQSSNARLLFMEKISFFLWFLRGEIHVEIVPSSNIFTRLRVWSNIVIYK